MNKVLPILLLLASSAMAQTKPTTIKPAAKPAPPAVDACAPIGRTAKGELVYSLKCDNLPASAQAAPQAEAPAAAPQPRNPKSAAAECSAGPMTAVR